MLFYSTKLHTVQALCDNKWEWILKALERECVDAVEVRMYVLKEKRYEWSSTKSGNGNSTIKWAANENGFGFNNFKNRNSTLEKKGASTATWIERSK